MGRPLWFVNLLKSIYRRRYFAALATRIPIIGGVIDRFVFKGDSLVCLPKDNVIQIDASIFPQKETVLPSQVVDYFIEHANYHWIMNFCMCRESNKCKDYPRDLGCLFLGEATTKINPNIGRPVSKSEARDHMQKGREAGLVHFIGNVKDDALWLGVSPGNKLLTICNCCPCCCISGLIKYMAPQIAENYSKMVGVEVKVSGSRLRLYKKKGVVCVKCGLEGSFFRLERHMKHPEDKFHFNLYGVDEKTNTVFMMTKDHIIPKAKGGRNMFENLQPMCDTCNYEKKDTLPGEKIVENSS